jgi:2-oxoglutarate ferredoxin oxidoreductase subunit alpha
MERFRLVQPVILSPFPEESLRQALVGSKKTILVEENALGQLQMLCARHTIPVDKAIHRYDGRPFSLEELRMRILEVA